MTFSEKHAVYEIMWKNMVESRESTDGDIIHLIRFAWWITKATRTYSEYVTLIAFPRQQ
jgi:hypothetical protein